MKKALLLAAGLLLAVTLPGCGDVSRPPAEKQTVSAAEEAVPAQHEATLVPYLPDEEGLRVEPHTMKVTAKEKTLKNALFQLIQLDRAQTYPLLPTGLTVKSVDVKDGTAVIDLSKEIRKLSGGSTGETLFVAMFVNTATEFPNVKEVRFLCEGQPLSKLGGHYDMTQAFKRDESMIRMEKK